MSAWDGNGPTFTRCCAKCRTPYNCGNSKCPCHGPTTEQLIAEMNRSNK